MRLDINKDLFFGYCLQRLRGEILFRELWFDGDRVFRNSNVGFKVGDC